MSVRHREERVVLLVSIVKKLGVGVDGDDHVDHEVSVW